MATITVTTYWNMDSRKWTSDLLGTTEQGPLAGIVQGDIVKFAVRFVQGGVAVALTAPVFTASGIKAQNDFTGGYLIQLSAPVLSDTTLYTFTVSPLNSAQLNTFLQTYRNTWCALELYDSANGILTTPLELQITPGYSLSGTPTDNVDGVIVVAAGKTVTFPLTLTFPSAAGTNGQQLTLSNSTTGLLEWAASGSSGITIGTTTANGTAGQVLYTDGSLVQAYAISGTGNVAMTTSPQFTTPSLGAATAASINGMVISSSSGIEIYPPGSPSIPSILMLNAANTAGSINTSGGASASGGSINTSNGGGYVKTSSSGGNIDTSSSGGALNTSIGGGYIDTSSGGGNIDTTGSGSIQFGFAANRITLVGTAGSNGKTQTLQNATGTVALTSDITGGTLAGSFTTLAVNGKSLTLGANLTTSGTDLPTFAFPSAATARTYTFPTTTATLARTDAAQTLTATQTISESTDRNGAAAGASLTISGAASVGPAFKMSTTAAGTFSVFVHATNGHTYVGTASGSLIVTSGVNSSGSTMFSVTSGGAFSIPGTLAVTGATTLTGLLTANGGITLGDAQNIAVNTTTGTKIGTATTQKIGFWNVTPVVQPAAVADSSGVLMDLTTQFNALLARLRSAGIIAT
jgi:hypothetical protein